MGSAVAAEDDDPDGFPRPFGQYLLLENFARGGMGEVYLAKIGGIAGLERYCVLKKLRSELTRDREYVTRFIDEARVVVTLNHANICHVFDVGRVGEEYYLAMEYISGRDARTLQDRIRTRAAASNVSAGMAPASALHVVCETLEALDYAHRRNHPLTGEPLKLVHRDVSPQNVLVSYEGEVKLIDFGLAASKLKVERTQPNVVMGKMAYMAPEQARGDPIDARADLFACGVFLYELLAGERFYEGMSANDIWQIAGKGGFAPRRWDTIDRDLQKHLSKALHPDPKKRFASCGDFREALASHLHWRYPGTGVRGLRELMCEVFAEEVRREREMLARFGTVTVAGFRTEFEETKSQSISLVRADETSPVPKGAALVRNEQGRPGPEQTGSTPQGAMPPPSTSLPSRQESGRDVHQDPTRLGQAPFNPNGGQQQQQGSLPRTASSPQMLTGGRLATEPTVLSKTEQKAKAKDTTDENKPEPAPAQSASAAGATQIVDRSALPNQNRGAGREMTMRVARAPRVRDVTATVDDRTDQAVEKPRNTAGRVFLIGAAAVLVVILVGGYYLARGGGDPATPPVPPVVAERPHDTPPHEIAPVPHDAVPHDAVVPPVKAETPKSSDVDLEPLSTTPAPKQQHHDPKKATTPSAHSADKPPSGAGDTSKHVAAVVETAPAPTPPTPVDDKPQMGLHQAVLASKSCPPCKEKGSAYATAAAFHQDDAKALSLGREVIACVLDNKCH